MPVTVFTCRLQMLPVLFLALLPAHNLFAQTDSTRIRSTPEMRAEIYDEYERSNKKITELNAGILQYLNSVKKPKAADYKRSYETSQAGWLAYRNGHCQIISDESADAPTGPDQFYYQCISDINSGRIEELKELLINFKLEFGALKME